MKRALLLPLLLLGACGENPAQPGDPQAAAPEILIESTRDGARHLYTLSTDGTVTVRLTHPPGVAFAGRWSPDGRKVVFVREHDMTGEDGLGRIVGQIYVMDADGSNPVRLTNQPLYDDDPGWSPDGSRIVFSRHWNTDFGIYVMNADGSNVVRLMSTGWRDSAPRWSPDGRRIAFLSNRGGPTIGVGPMRIHLMDADGSNLVQLPAPHFSRGVDRFEWAPDGSKIVFAFADNLWTVEVTAATQIAPLTGFPADMVGLPVWSPDARRIAFASTADHSQGGTNVFVMNIDGTGRRNLTRNQGWGNRVTSWRTVP